jgi:hypothetical protein
LHYVRADLLGPSFSSAPRIALDRALHIALDDNREQPLACTCRRFLIICSANRERRRRVLPISRASSAGDYSVTSRARASFSTTLRRSPASGVA